MESIGLKAILDDKDFQAGLGRYVSGLSRAESATQRTAGVMTSLGHTISTAIGTAIGFLSAQAIPQIASAMMGPINVTRAWGEQLDELGDIFGLTDTAGASFAIAMKKVGINVDEGAGSFSYFSRQVVQTKDQLADAASNYASATGDIASAHADAVNKISRDWQQTQADAADSIATVWQDLAEKRADIETSMADQITSINESLQERLSDIADQRAKLERDTTKSLAKLTEDTKDRLRNAHSARERRQIRKDAAERKAEIILEAAERKAELDKQEAREKAHAAKQIALAEKVAQKQIEAAEKAADKQTAAIEKALAKQQKAMQEQMAETDKSAAKQLAAAKKALTDVADKSPLSKALKTLGLDFKKTTDESRPFEERLADIMDAFAKLPPGVDASALAIQLFGRAGIKWLDFLRQGRKGLEEAKKLGIDLGLVLDSSQAEEFGRSLNMLQLSFDALGVNIGRAVLPVVNELVKGFTQFMNLDIVPAVRKLVDRVVAGFKAGGIEGAASEFWKALTEPSGVFDQLGKFVQRIRDWFTTGDGQKILQGAGNAFNGVIAAFTSWVNSDDGQKAIRILTIDTMTVIGQGLALAIKIAKWIGDVMTQLAQRLDDWVNSAEGRRAMATIARDIFNAIVQGLKDDFSNRDWGATVMGMMSSTLRYGVAGQISALANLGTSIGTAILNALTSAITSKNVAGDLANWLRTNLKNALVSMGSPWSNLAGMIFGGTTPTPTPTNTNPSSVPYTDTEYQTGGPVRRTGMALVHAGEYVLNRQQAMAWAPALASTSTVYNFNHTWPAAVPPSQREWTESMVRRVTQQEVRGILGKG